jgi:hypothetical protein
MGRDIRKVRIAGRERQRRYRERLRKDRAPNSEAVHRAIRQALAEAAAEYRGPDALAVTHFLATVAAVARRRLAIAGYDPWHSRDRIHRAMLGEDFPPPPSPPAP